MGQSLAPPPSDVEALTAENARLRAEVDRLQHALDSRAVIEQAKGVVAQRDHVDVQKAFDLLRNWSRDNNQKLVEVCTKTVASTTSDIW